MDPATAMMMLQAIQGALKSDPGQGQFNSLGHGYNAYTANSPMDRLSSMVKGAAGGALEGKIGQLADANQLSLLEQKLGIQNTADLNRLREAIPIDVAKTVAIGGANEQVAANNFQSRLDRENQSLLTLGGTKNKLAADEFNLLEPLRRQANVQDILSSGRASTRANVESLPFRMEERQLMSDQDLQNTLKRYDVLAPVEKRQREEAAAMELQQADAQFRQRVEQEAMMAGMAPEAYLAALRAAADDKARMAREKHEADLGYTEARTRAAQSQKPGWLDSIFGGE